MRTLPKVLAFAAAITAITQAQLAQAQQNAAGETVEEIVVTSSRIPVPLRQIGISISVIDAADIEARGNVALTDVLRQLPAVAITSNGGIGKSTSLRIRGEEGFRTLTIMDGMRLTDPSAPQVGPQLEHLLSSGINRVEILRGPQGLSYGADAGGILNISSRTGSEGVLANLDAQGGEFGTRQVSANVGGGNATADFFVSAARFETDSFNTRTSDSVFQDKDGYENDTVHLRGGINLNPQWRLDLVHRRVDGESKYDGCFSPTMNGHDCLSISELSASRIALGYEGADFTHSLSFNSTDTDRDNLSSGVSSFDAQGELTRWEYVGSATNLPGFDLVFGADQEQALNGGVGRDNTGLYLEYLSDFSDSLHFTAGARHDDNDDFGTNTSYRVSGAYLLDLANDATLKFKGSYGTGFRAPSPFEIAYNRSPSGFPPASLVTLKQETSKGWEAGVEYTLANLRLEAVYFDQDVEDAIFFDLVAFSGYLQDVGLSTSKGVELSGEWSINDNWRINANYTYNDTELPNGQPRRRRPEDLTNVGLSWYGLDQRLNLNAFLRASRNSFDQSGGALVQLDDFDVLDLTGNFSLTENIQLYGRLENALDEDYQEIIGYNTAGQAAYIGIRLNFSAL